MEMHARSSDPSPSMDWPANYYNLLDLGRDKGDGPRAYPMGAGWRG